MFWIGIIITLSSGVLGIESMRTRLLHRFPRVSCRGVDVMLCMLLVLGVAISTAQYVSDQRELQGIGKHVETLQFQDLARYSVFGHQSGLWNGVPVVRTPLNGWCDSFVSRDQGVLSWKFDEKTEIACRAALAKVPRFPFAHFFVASIMKQKGSPEWRREATDTLRLF